MSKRLTRRQLLRNSALAGVGIWAARGGRGLAYNRSPNEKLNIALIGCGGRGAGNLKAVAETENIVALCDVDESRAAATYKKYGDVNKFADFRKMLDEMHQQIDAVIVATPDHCHAPAAVRAMRLRKHVYCEKPLCWSVKEARLMRNTAAEFKVATQMGNQGTATDGFRRGVEVLRAGAIGQVRQMHIWTNRPGHWWKNGLDRPTETPPVPPSLKWNLWLGPAPWRPYHPVYVPHDWRGWLDFGTGALGDMACHTMNQAFCALKLEDPSAVKAESSRMNGESYPLWSVIRWEFPARGDLVPMTMTWYDGWQTGGKRPPAEWLEGEELKGSGVLLIGDEGKFYSPHDYGSQWTLLPKEKFRDYQGPAESIPRSPGHHAEWIAACKGGAAAMSHFDYAARLTETVLLGIVALRAGKKIQWDAAQMRVPNCAEANQFLRRDNREGWEI